MKYYLLQYLFLAMSRSHRLCAFLNFGFTDGEIIFFYSMGIGHAHLEMILFIMSYDRYKAINFHNTSISS